MEIAVINLERAVERRARMTILLQRFALDFSFSQAVDAAAGEHLAFSNYDPACAVRARRGAYTRRNRVLRESL
jgi:hypothetical protein